MLSKEEIEAFMDDADEFEATTSAPPQAPSSPWMRSVRMVTLTSRAQVAMVRSFQKAICPPRW